MWELECNTYGLQSSLLGTDQADWVSSHFAWQHWLVRIVSLPHVPYVDELADFFTKAHPIHMFQFFVRKLFFLDTPWVWCIVYCVFWAYLERRVLLLMNHDRRVVIRLGSSVVYRLDRDRSVPEDLGVLGEGVRWGPIQWRCWDFSVMRTCYASSIFLTNLEILKSYTQ